MLQLIFLIFVFQSTLSVRRATVRFPRSFQFLSISIHALRKESDLRHYADALADKISIHALRKESDENNGILIRNYFISIHALRKESDEQQSAKEWKMTHFNPRSP